ncbi:A disintegrin and metallo ase with thrombospondin motifs 16-like, partial [Brachionus plicatilis]
MRKAIESFCTINKELLSNDISLPISQRAGTAGYCPGAICSNLKFSINEDFGGFSNMIVIAHELGHNLGAAHDDFYAQCIPTQNQRFIMASSLTGGNLNRFSSCSIEQFKSFLLNPSLTGASQQAQCLLNKAQNLVENNLTKDKQPGEFLSPDDQCKMIH